MNELEQIINEIIENNDTEKLEELLEMYSKDYSYKFIDQMDDIDAETRIKFYLCVMKHRKENKKLLETKLIKRIIPGLLMASIEENEELFERIVDGREDSQQIIIDYIKESPTNISSVWKVISDWPITKREILDDEEFVANMLRNESLFFEQLPEGYEHLLGYYNSKFNEFDFNYLLPLYERYYGKEIGTLQQIKLIYLQLFLKQKLGFSNYVQMQPLDFILKALHKDNSFVDTIEELSQKTNLDFSNTAILVYKYRDSKLLKDLRESEVIDEEMSKKIEYIANNNRIIGINSIEDLQSKSIEELSTMETETIYGINALGRGSPIAETMKAIFADSEEREIRRIDQDGATDRMSVELEDGHDDIIGVLYSDDVNFPEDCKDAFHRSVEVAKQISAVTLVIESEKCYIYLPSDISEEQMRICQELIESSISEGKFGITVYDREIGDYYVETQNDLFDKEKTKRFLKKIGEKQRKKIANEDERVEETREDI